MSNSSESSHTQLLFQLLEKIEASCKRCNFLIDNVPKQEVNIGALEESLRKIVTVCDGLSSWEGCDYEKLESLEDLHTKDKQIDMKSDTKSGIKNDKKDTQIDTRKDRAKDRLKDRAEDNLAEDSASQVKKQLKCEQYWLSVDAFNAYTTYEFEKSMEQIKYGTTAGESSKKYDYAFPRSKIRYNEAPLDSQTLLSTVFRSNVLNDENELTQLRGISMNVLQSVKKYSNPELQTIHVPGRGTAWYDIKSALDDALPLFSPLEKDLIGKEVRHFFTLPNDLDGIADVIPEEERDLEAKKEEKKREKQLKKKKYAKPKKKKKSKVASGD